MGAKLGTPARPPPTLSTYDPLPPLQGNEAPLSSSLEGYYISNYSIHRVNRGVVVFYHIELHGGSIIKRRFNDFKAFHRSTKVVAPSLPPLPSSGWRTALSRRDPDMIQERCIRFQHLLNAAPQDRVDTFLAPRRRPRHHFSRLWRAVRSNSLRVRQWCRRRRMQRKHRCAL